MFKNNFPTDDDFDYLQSKIAKLNELLNKIKVKVETNDSNDLKSLINEARSIADECHSIKSVIKKQMIRNIH